MRDKRMNLQKLVERYEETFPWYTSLLQRHDVDVAVTCLDQVRVGKLLAWFGFEGGASRPT